MITDLQRPHNMIKQTFATNPLNVDIYSPRRSIRDQVYQSELRQIPVGDLPCGFAFSLGWLYLSDWILSDTPWLKFCFWETTQQASRSSWDEFARVRTPTDKLWKTKDIASLGQFLEHHLDPPHHWWGPYATQWRFMLMFHTSSCAKKTTLMYFLAYNKKYFC